MKVTVRLFAQMRMAAGRRQVELDLPDGSTLGSALEILYRAHPDLREAARSCLVAVGLEYAPSSHRMSPGEEISLIPPVQGG